MITTFRDSVTNEVLVLQGQVQAVEFEVEIGERDVLDAIARFECPAVGVAALMKIGACATLATGTGYDINAVRKEIDRLVGDTGSAVANFREQMLSAISDEGPLAEALSNTCTELDKAVREILAHEGDPEIPQSLLARMQGVTQRIGEVLDSTHEAIAETFEKTTERHVDKIDRTLREMRDLDPASAMGQAFERLEKKFERLQESIAAAQATAQERQRGTAKGGDFEDLVTQEVAAIAAVFGDRAEHTGNQPGKLLQKKGPSKRGDVTCLIDGVPAIVFESMNRGKSELTPKLVLPELEEAMMNRSADTAIAVVASVDNRLMNGQPLQILGPNKWAVVLDENDIDLLPLRIAYRLARHAATLSVSETKTVDFDALKLAVEAVNEKLAGLGDVKTHLDNIARSGDNAMLALGRVQREARTAISGLLESLEAEAAESDALAEAV